MTATEKQQIARVEQMATRRSEFKPIRDALVEFVNARDQRHEAMARIFLAEATANRLRVRLAGPFKRKPLLQAATAQLAKGLALTEDATLIAEIKAESRKVALLVQEQVDRERRELDSQGEVWLAMLCGSAGPLRRPILAESGSAIEAEGGGVIYPQT
jgi:hypothetical protein